MRALIDAERWQEANELVAAALMGKPIKQMPFGTAGDLLLDFPGLGGATGYRRTLDLDSAVASTTFTDGRSTHRREVFCSAPDQVAVIRLEVQGDGVLDLDLGYRHPEWVKQYGAPKYDADGAVYLGAAWDHHEALRADQRRARW